MNTANNGPSFEPESDSYDENQSLTKNEKIDQTIIYDKPTQSLFGNGENPDFLHPSNVTYNADLAIEIGNKTILLQGESYKM